MRTFSEVSPRDWVRQVRADRRGMEEVPLVLHYPQRVHEVQHRLAKVSLLRLCNESKYVPTRYSLPTWTTSLEWHACAEGGRVPGDDEQRLALLPQLHPLGHRRRRLRRLRLL